MKENHYRKNDIVEQFLNPSRPVHLKEGCIEIKNKLNFYFHTSLWYLKRFYEGLKGITKRCQNKKFKLVFFFLSGIRTLRVKIFKILKIGDIM